MKDLEIRVTAGLVFQNQKTENGKKIQPRKRQKHTFVWFLVQWAKEVARLERGRWGEKFSFHRFIDRCITRI